MQSVDGAAAAPRYYWLDWCRFLAAFGVLLVHARANTWIDYAHLVPSSRNWATAALFAATRLGDEMVVFFFVLSGFLVGGKVIERVRNNSFDVRTYAIDRVSRLWLPLLPVLLLTLLVGWFINRSTTPLVVAGHIAGLQGVWVDYLPANAALWSLTYEIWCYVLAGAGAVLLGSSEWKWWSLPAVVLAVIVLAALEFAWVAAWWAGAAGYFLSRHSRVLLVAGLLLAAIGAVLMQLTGESEYPLSFAFAVQLALLPRSLWLLLLAAGSTLVVAVLAVLKPRQAHWQRLEAAGSTLAAFSYSLYLIHMPLLAAMDYAFNKRFDIVNLMSMSWFLFKLLSVLLFAWCFHRVFEARTPQLRRWLRQRWVPA